MTHIEIYTIKGKKYRYEVTNYRVGNKIKHKKKYLGPLEKTLTRKKGAGRKPTLKICQLTHAEVITLNKNFKSSESFVKDRAKILLLSLEGKTIKEISKSTGVYRPRIEKIINGFNKNHFAIFQRKKGTGRPRRITPEERAKIVQFVNTEPLKLGLHFSNWSLPKLAAYAKSQNIQVSIAQVQRILKADNIKYKKKVSWLFSNDPDFDKKNF